MSPQLDHIIFERLGLVHGPHHRQAGNRYLQPFRQFFNVLPARYSSPIRLSMTGHTYEQNKQSSLKFLISRQVVPPYRINGFPVAEEGGGVSDSFLESRLNSCTLPMLRRPFHSRQTVGGIDQGKVGQRLREIPNEPLFGGIILFGK